MNKHINFFISRLNNAYKLKKSSIITMFSKEIINILKILKVGGYLTSYTILKINSRSFCKVLLKVPISKMPTRRNIVNNCDSFFHTGINFFKKPFRNISVISKSSRNYYHNIKQLRNFYNCYHTKYIISTIYGFMFLEEAIKKNVGGKLYIAIKL